MKKPIFILSLLCLLSGAILSSCENKGNEPVVDARHTIACMRLPLENEVPGLDYFDGDEAMKYRVKENAEALTPALRQIVAEVLQGKAQCYDEFHGKAIDNHKYFNQVYNLTDQDWADITNHPKYETILADMSQTMEVVYDFKMNTAGVTKSVQEVRLIWRDPAGIYPEKDMGYYHLEDLPLNELRVTYQGRSMDLVTFLEEEEPEMFPILTELEKGGFGVKTLEEAYQTKERIYNGTFVGKELL